MFDFLKLLKTANSVLCFEKKKRNKIKYNPIKLSLLWQDRLDGEEADFRRRAWGKGTPALPKTKRPFVSLLLVAMVTEKAGPEPFVSS